MSEGPKLREAAVVKSESGNPPVVFCIQLEIELLGFLGLLTNDS